MFSYQRLSLSGRKKIPHYIVFRIWDLGTLVNTYLSRSTKPGNMSESESVGSDTSGSDKTTDRLTADQTRQVEIYTSHLFSVYCLHSLFWYIMKTQMCIK